MDPALHPRSFRSFLAAARRRTAGSGLFYLLLPLFFSLAALAPSARPLGRLWKLPVVMMAAQAQAWCVSGLVAAGVIVSVAVAGHLGCLQKLLQPERPGGGCLGWGVG